MLFGVKLRGPAAEPTGWMTAPADLLHGTLAWLLLALIGGHVAMALVHQFLWQDGRLGLILGRKARFAIGGRHLLSRARR